MKTAEMCHSVTQHALGHVARESRVSEKLRFKALSKLDSEYLHAQATDPVTRFGIFHQRAMGKLSNSGFSLFPRMLEDLTPESVDYPDYVPPRKQYEVWSAIIALRMGWFNTARLKDFFHYYSRNMRAGTSTSRDAASLQTLDNLCKSDADVVKSAIATQPLNEVFTYLALRDPRLKNDSEYQKWTKTYRPLWAS